MLTHMHIDDHDEIAAIYDADNVMSQGSTSTLLDSG